MSIERVSDEIEGPIKSEYRGELRYGYEVQVHLTENPNDSKRRRFFRKHGVTTLVFGSHETYTFDDAQERARAIAEGSLLEVWRGEGKKFEIRIKPHIPHELLSG